MSQTCLFVYGIVDHAPLFIICVSLMTGRDGRALSHYNTVRLVLFIALPHCHIRSYLKSNLYRCCMFVSTNE